MREDQKEAKEPCFGELGGGARRWTGDFGVPIGGRRYSAPAYAGSASRPSRIFLRTSCAAALISCIFLRTRVPAALFPPMALFTSSSASCTRRLSVSNSCTVPPQFGLKSGVGFDIDSKTLLP